MDGDTGQASATTLTQEQESALASKIIQTNNNMAQFATQRVQDIEDQAAMKMTGGFNLTGALRQIGKTNPSLLDGTHDAQVRQQLVQELQNEHQDIGKMPLAQRSAIMNFRSTVQAAAGIASQSSNEINHEVVEAYRQSLPKGEAFDPNKIDPNVAPASAFEHPPVPGPAEQAGQRPAPSAKPVKPAAATPGTKPQGIGSKFVSPEKAEQLRQKAEALVKQHLKLTDLDTNKVPVADAQEDDKHNLLIKLKNGHQLQCGVQDNGNDYIGAPPGAKGPLDRSDVQAMASLAKSRGWNSVHITSKNPQEAAMMAIEAQRAGLKVDNPPDARVVAQVQAKMDAEDKAKGIQTPGAAAAPPPAGAAPPRRPPAGASSPAG